MDPSRDVNTTPPPLSETLKRTRLCVCCGAGGVGKTTSSAALALLGARQGRRVLALTIDPSKRLAQTLGVARNTPEPVELDRARLTALGVPAEGSLSAWLLDPQLVSDRVVNREAGAEAETLKRNSIYREISGMVAGMQEYTAVEALHDFLKRDEYDLIVLDTPPSRHALRFLDSPKRVAALLDKRIFHLFVPSKTGLIGRVASKVLDEVLDRAFGEEPRRELKQFFELFSRILAHLNDNQREMSAIFESDAVRFFMVTTARDDAIDEARRFTEEAAARGLHLGGFLLNRCPTLEPDLSEGEVALRAQLASRLEELLDECKLESEPQDELKDELKSELFTLLGGHLDQRVSACGLRADTTRELSKLAPLYRLRELTLDASSLEGISALADQFTDIHTHTHTDQDLEDATR